MTASRCLASRRQGGHMGELEGKVAVVTGASKGIGAAIAKWLGAAGAAVVVNYASSREGADRVVAEITGKGGRAVAVQGDVAKAADVRRLFEETRRAFGPVDARVKTHASWGVETEGLHGMGISGSDLEKQMVAQTPVGRQGQPDDIAGEAVFLASDAARWLSGECIAASGGLR